jgi:hypothetical protein
MKKALSRRKREDKDRVKGEAVTDLDDEDKIKDEGRTI